MPGLGQPFVSYVYKTYEVVVGGVATGSYTDELLKDSGGLHVNELPSVEALS